MNRLYPRRDVVVLAFSLARNNKNYKYETFNFIDKIESPINGLVTRFDPLQDSNRYMTAPLQDGNLY